MKLSVPLVFLLTLAGSAQAAEMACEDLAKVSLPHTQITEAKVIAKGAFPAPVGRNGQVQNAALFANLPAFCRVTATLRPVADSEIKVEIWLPQQGWNGRLHASGNGGFGSSISNNDLAASVAAGFAAVVSNTGHEGSGAAMIGHPEKIIDWGYRAVHEMTVMAKALITARYGTPAKYAYWNSCSTGGRQGLVAAEYYPEDFDGLAIGDAANPMTRNQASTLYSNLAMNKDSTTLMSPAKWQAYRQAVMNKCDALDGLKDGVLTNPLACKFDPREMLCKSGDREDCLTAPQVSALNTVLAGMKHPRTGEQLHPGWSLGTVPANFVTGPKPEDVAVDTFRALFNNADWDYRTMDFDKDLARADQLGNPVMNAIDPSRLSKLFARGGKILFYHGWDDPSITPLQAIKYYDQAVATNGGIGKTYDNIRLFMLPGLGHCGQYFDKRPLIVDWVENGTAPDRIVASYAGQDGKVTRTRPVCPYPQVPKYNGSGSIDAAQNFSCAAP